MSSARDRTIQFNSLNRETRLSSSLIILFSQAVSERLGVHSTDIETMDLLNIYGPMTAGQLADRAGLTTGATTRLIDRLEHAGFVRRRHDSQDRRRVIIEPNWDNASTIMECFESLGRRMVSLWQEFSPEQLATITSYLHRVNEIMAEENALLRGRPIPGETPEPQA